MPRIISIWFLIIFFLPASSTYLSFKLRQYQIRKEIKYQIKSSLNETELILLKIPVSLEANPTKDFQRMHAGEFRYQGNMYDIVKQESHRGTTWYWCIWDKQETALFANLDEMVNRALTNNPVQQASHDQLKRFLDSLYYFTAETALLILPAEQLSVSEGYKKDRDISRAIAPLTPPPQS